MKMSNTKSRIRSTMKKVAKTNNNKLKSEIVTISLKQHEKMIDNKNNNNNNINEMARKLKLRLTNVAKKLTKQQQVVMDTVPELNKNVSMQQDVYDTPMTSPILSPTTSLSDADSLIETPPPLTKVNSLCLLNSSSTSAAAVAAMDSPPISPTSTTQMLADADWSNKTSPTTTKSSLYNLELLKQYLTFVSQETNDIQLKDNTIQFNMNNQEELVTPETDIQQASRLGATLIELSVHDPTMKIENNKPKSTEGHHLKNPNGASRTSNNNNNSRRRPGRPPKSSQKLTCSEDLLKFKHKRHSLLQRQQEYQEEKKKKKETIDCICNVAHEEFGTMVQCDDCLSWLHLDCLELDEKALDETFRCPSCFIKFGRGQDDQVKLLSTVTWRYAAKYQSEVLAGLERTEDEDEYDEDMELDTDVSVFSYQQMVTTPPLSQTNNNNDWCDTLSSNSSQDGYSEAGTPSEHQAGSDDYWFAPPSAANVFLWDNNNIQKSMFTTPVLTTSLSADIIEPSAVCDQELPQFNFWDAAF